MARKKILWLCSWYPNRTDPFDGDFIQRHARAAALYHDIQVIRVVADSALAPGVVETELTDQAHLAEQIIYLGKGKGLLGRFLFYRRWNSVFKQAIEKYLAEQGPPSVIHVHVPYPAGRMALWLQQKIRRPYVVTEHWTIYQPGSEIGYGQQPVRMRSLITSVLNGAATFLPVSANLGQLIHEQVTQVPTQVIRNVVDTSLFFFKEQAGGRNLSFRFIHVSGLSIQKNPEGLLRAFAAARQEDPDMELWILGNRDQTLPSYAAKLGLSPEAIKFGGEVSYSEVARQMQVTDALILFSQVENAPCVISEALCCGLPVIATITGGIPEMLDESNGLMIEPGDEMAMKNALLKLKQSYDRYNRAQIALKAAALYNYETVGKELSAVYESLSQRIAG
jgi:glycosyltransferase involved in cell wall biosynthesis